MAAAVLPPEIMIKLSISRIPSNPVSFGLVCNFVAQYPPFDNFEFGLMVKSLRFQLDQQTHLVGSIDDKIVAYLWVDSNQPRDGRSLGLG